MKNFTINRKVYKAKEFDFNLVCDLEDEGISLEAMQDKPMSMMRAYFGICAGIGRNAAGEEMQKHIVSGGSFEEMAEAMSDAMEQSDFFGLPTRQRKRKLRKIRAKRNKKKLQIVS